MKVKKAIEIIDAEIEFVSLVDKAANKRQFLFAKDENGQSGIKIQNKLIKADDGSHTVVGVVYEPGTEDAHGNFMKADEIAKAAELFNEQGEGVDTQHNEVAIEDGVTIVKSWVTEDEETLYGEVIKSGTWLMEIEITDDDIWKSIEDGDITGFSMGGSGTYILEEVEPVDKSEKVGMFKNIMKMLGLTAEDVIEKGEVMDRFNKRTKMDAFWNAKIALDDTLRKWKSGHWENDEWIEGEYEFETDQAIITEALNEFTTIVNAILADPGLLGEMIANGVSKSVVEKMEVRKANKVEPISKGEIDDMEKKDVEKLVTDSIAKALEEAGITKAEPAATPEPKTEAEIIAEAVAKAMDEAVPAKPEETLEEKIAKAIESEMKTRGISKQVDTEETIEIEKSDVTKGYMSKINQ